MSNRHTGPLQLRRDGSRRQGAIAMNASSPNRSLRQHSGEGLNAQSLFSDVEWRELAESLELSDRELQIAKGVVADLKEATIASRLGISRHTVHTHLERLYRKLGVSSRNALLVRLFSTYIEANRRSTPAAVSRRDLVVEHDHRARRPVG
jgi:DNA-binding CsgD family transcriptional regulator